MNESPIPDLPAWDELDLPVLEEVVDETAVPVLDEESFDVPDFDFSGELDAMQTTLSQPAASDSGLEIPELTLEDLDVANVAAGNSTLDLASLPSLDLTTFSADELSLADVLPDLPRAEAAAARLAEPQEQALLRPEVPLEVAGFDFALEPMMPVAPPVLSGESVAEAESSMAPSGAPESWIEPAAADLAMNDSLFSSGPADQDSMDALSEPQPPGLPAGLSINLDSLPSGVLGGGIGRIEEETPSAAELLAKAQALVSASPSLDDIVRSAEMTLQQEYRHADDATLPVETTGKSFAELNDEELAAAMADLPGVHHAALHAIDTDESPSVSGDMVWPALDTNHFPVADAGLLLDEATLPIEAARPDGSVSPAVALSDVDQEEGWPSLGDVDRLNETEVEPPDEASVEAAIPLLQAEWQDEPAESDTIIPIEHAAVPLLEPEEAWPGVGDVDHLNETEVEQSEPGTQESPVLLSPDPQTESLSAASLAEDAEGEAVFKSQRRAANGMDGLFGESPFASERQVLSDKAATGIPLLDERVQEEAAGLPEQEAASLSGVEVLNVSAVAAARPGFVQPKAEATVAVVDERALVDAMYEKLLPRMKVELSLWLQDALELQAKNMLSGVMQQLKEDYDMLFGETLKESLRQAILALGREQQDKQQGE